MFYRAFFFVCAIRAPVFAPVRALICHAIFYATHTPLFLRPLAFFAPACHTLSHTLLRSTLNRQAKCASHAFFCSHTHAPSHLNATRQIPCRTLSRAFLRHARHAFFIFIILNSAWILKIFINFFAVFLCAIYFLKFTFKISIFDFKISCLF